MVGDVARKQKFNKIHSSARICVEMAFGRLKARFPSLHCMGVVSDIDDLYRSVEALLVLHNICIDFGDSVVGEYGNEPLEEGEDLLDDSRFAGHISDSNSECGGREDDENDNNLLQRGRALLDHYLNMMV